MQVIFESRHDHGNQLRELSIERTRFTFRRVACWIPRVNVQFADVNGPRDGLDKRCQVELSNGSAAKVVIVSLAHDWRTALDLSLQRAVQVFKRSMQRNRKPLRGRSASFAIDRQTMASYASAFVGVHRVARSSHETGNVETPSGARPR